MTIKSDRNSIFALSIFVVSLVSLSKLFQGLEGFELEPNEVFGVDKTKAKPLPVPVPQLNPFEGSRDFGIHRLKSSAQQYPNKGEFFLAFYILYLAERR